MSVSAFSSRKRKHANRHGQKIYKVTIGVIKSQFPNSEIDSRAGVYSSWILRVFSVGWLSPAGKCLRLQWVIVELR